MNSYFSNFISRFGGNDLFISSAYSNAAETAKVPEINYITLFNPTWVDDNDESLDNLSKQILFFITPDLNDENELDNEQLDKRKGEQLNVVGLLRGSCSLAREFGNSKSSVTVLVTGAAIVVIEIEKNYELACSIALPPFLCERHELIRIQIESLIRRAHRTFNLLNPLFGKLKELFCGAEMCSYLQNYWFQFMVNFNEASKVPFGPRLLGWPNRMNHQGVFEFLPNNNYRKSCVKVPDSLSGDLEDIVRQFSLQPTGYFVVNYSKAMPKKYGLIYSKMDWTDDVIEKEAMVDLYNLLEFLEYHGGLVADRLGKRNPLSNLFTQLDTTSVHLLEAEEEEEEEEENLTLAPFNLNPAAAIGMLHPVNITNNLVIQPLNNTVNGLKSLGLAVNGLLPATPTWWGFGSFGSSAPSMPQNPTEDEDVQSRDESGSFIIGVNGDDTLTRFLIYLPTVTGDRTEIREYLLVLYAHEEVVQGFIFDSGLEQLGQKSFYEELKWDVCEQTMEIFRECFQISSGGIGLNTSISSLPNPLKTIISGKSAESQTAQYEDVDSDFFFIIYDTKDHSYQSSLPYLPISVPMVDGEVVKLAQSLNNAMFHLHDQLADHFVVKSAGRVFTPLSVVNEHLHKFSSNKNNSWLFYSIRHKNKAIVIIRNFNTKHKQPNTARNVPRLEAANGYLNQLSESVHDYASLGFLDTLGEDVKVWLEKLGRNET